MSNYIKYDIDQFDCDKRYDIYSEHCWDIMKSDSKAKKYFEDREEIGKPIEGFVQCTAEKTGQMGTLF